MSTENSLQPFLFPMDQTLDGIRSTHSQEMLTFRQQILSFLGALDEDVDASSTNDASWRGNEGKTLKMLTFRQHLRFYPSFRLEMLTFGQDLIERSVSLEVCVRETRRLREDEGLPALSGFLRGERFGAGRALIEIPERSADPRTIGREVYALPAIRA